MIVIGLDPGTCTGFGVWDAINRKLLKVESWTILQAMQQVLIWRDVSNLALVIFEDARLTRIGGGATFGQAERLQGVGSVKRDCAIWEEFLTAQGIPFLGRTPRNTKIDAEKFAQLTGWTERSNEHGRDGAMIVHGLNVPMIEANVRAASDGRPADKARSLLGRSRPRAGRRRRNSPG